MHLVEKATGDTIEVEVLEVKSSELKKVNRSKQFGFNWEKVEGDIYKLVSTKNGEVIALMGMIEQPEFGFRYVEVTAIEKRKSEKGKPEYEKVAGRLLAFAARESFRHKLEGYVFLISKTDLRDLYERYGFEATVDTGLRMFSRTPNSRRLTNEFL
jgi:hypothetical protein